MKMGNGNSHCKFLYNYIEKLLFCALVSLQNDLIGLLPDLDRSRKTDWKTDYKAESRKRNQVGGEMRNSNSNNPTASQSVLILLR